MSTPEDIARALAELRTALPSQAYELQALRHAPAVLDHRTRSSGGSTPTEWRS